MKSNKRSVLGRGVGGGGGREGEGGGGVEGGGGGGEGGGAGDSMKWLNSFLNALSPVAPALDLGFWVWDSYRA